MKYRHVLFLAAALTGAAQADVSLPSEEPGGTSILAAYFPEATRYEHDNGHHVWSFCPDNTCVEFKQKDRKALVERATLYLYYFGDYYMLEDWRASAETKTSIGGLLQRQKLHTCRRDEDGASTDVDLVCLAQKLKASRLQVSNLRYDEGHEARVKVW